MGIFSRLFGGAKEPAQDERVLETQPAPPEDLLGRALLPALAHDPALYARMVAYVRTGEPAEVPLETAQVPAGVLFALFRGPANSGHFTPSAADNEAWKRIGTSQMDVGAARHRYYASTPPPAELVRMAKLLVAIVGSVGPVERALDGTPVWATALVNDVVRTMQEAAAGRRIWEIRQHRERVGEIAPHWEPEFLVRLLQADGAGPEEAAGAAVLASCEPAASAHGLGPFDLPWLNGLLAIAGGSLQPAAAAALQSDGRTMLMERARAHPEIAIALASVIAAFALDTVRTTRTAALFALEVLPANVHDDVLLPVLLTAAPARARDLVNALGRTETGAALLNRAIDAGAKLAAIASQATERREVLVDTTAAERSGPGESPRIATPPFVPVPEVRLGEQTVAELRAWVAGEIRVRSQDASEAVQKSLDRLRGYTDQHFRNLVAVANGDAVDLDLYGLKHYGARVLRRMAPSLNLVHILRLAAADSYPRSAWGSIHPYGLGTMDFRVIEDAIFRAGIPADDSTEAVTAMLAKRVRLWPTSMTWAWTVDHPQLLRTWLTGNTDDASYALRVLDLYPELPVSLLPHVAEVALGSSKTLRPIAQDVLRGHPAALSLAIHGLTDGKGENRSAAAAWLASQINASDLSSPEHVEGIRALEHALANERREAPRAELLAALERVGADISPHLSPAILLAEAKKGMRAKLPVALGWFDLDQVPAARWNDGERVEPLIIQWWVVLAHKLRNPDGSGLIDRYLSLLYPEDSAAIGRFMLSAWIEHDTVHPSEEESQQFAERVGAHEWQYAQTRLANAQRQANVSTHSLEYAAQAAAVPRENRIRAQYLYKRAEYVGSATADKGLLALTTRVPGGELAATVQGYVRAHGARRAQVEALIHTLFGSGQPATIQLLLSVSRRFKQVTVQMKAKELVERLAEVRGWTADELADRTVPTAGFGDDRLLRLSFGEREFIGRLNTRYGIELSDPDGKRITALPKPRVSDDAEAAAAAKKQLSASRKEVTAVATLQQARLYEAMCLSRRWWLPDWQEFLLGHPLMSQLISRLIWQEVCSDGSQRYFRPAEDGELLDANDNEVTLEPGSTVLLAHRVGMSDDDATRWRRALADYDIAPLFDQLSHTLPETRPATGVFDDLAGHMTDTFSFRGTAAKLGYQRDHSGDGGWFSAYTKPFASVEITASVEFTGSYLPEENIACATERLTFERAGDSLPLSAIPPRLLAEAYADYAAFAALGPHDPEYRKKTGL